MADDEKKIFVDDDWKTQAREEQARLAEEQAGGGESGDLPDPNFTELLNLIVTPALAGFGLLAGPDGQRIPPNLDVAKHYIDLLQVFADKTQGSLAEDEQQVLDQVLYDLRMRFVQMASGGGDVSGGQMPPSPGA